MNAGTGDDGIYDRMLAEQVLSGIKKVYAALHLLQMKRCANLLIGV